MSRSPITLLSLNTAPVASLQIQGRAVRSAIGKQPRAGVLSVGTLGLQGDEQADASVHGGAGKAVYAYPSEHYPWWQAQRRMHGVDMLADEALPHGFLGENLTLSGLLEQEVYVGDVLHFPDCSLRVTEPRQPCFKFVHIMGYAQAAKDMVASGHSGWYLAVECPGTLCAGQTATLARGARQMPLRDLLRKRRSD